MGCAPCLTHECNNTHLFVAANVDGERGAVKIKVGGGQVVGPGAVGGSTVPFTIDDGVAGVAITAAVVADVAVVVVVVIIVVVVFVGDPPFQSVLFLCPCCALITHC